MTLLLAFEKTRDCSSTHHGVLAVPPPPRMESNTPTIRPRSAVSVTICCGWWTLSGAGRMYLLTVEIDVLRRGVEDALERGPVDVDADRLVLLCELAAIYEAEGVLLDGLALPLWRDCPCAAPCWDAFPESWQPGRDPSDPWNGGIALPWIGSSFCKGGVVVLGSNLREASGLYVEYEIAHTQLEMLESGHEKPHNSWWAYRSSRSAAAVMCSLGGHRELDVSEPAALAPVLDGTARVQAVKCSSKDGALSERTAEMSGNCPPRYLRRELAVLEPRVVVALGDEAWSAVELIGDIDESVGGAESPDRQCRWTMSRSRWCGFDTRLPAEGSGSGRSRTSSETSLTTRLCNESGSDRSSSRPCALPLRRVMHERPWPGHATSLAPALKETG